MPFFYFHLKTDSELYLDEAGTEMASLAEAKHEAVLSAREILADAIRTGKPKAPEAFVIADEAGRTLHVLEFETLLPKLLKK
jgi:hypothetical protein